MIFCRFRGSNELDKQDKTFILTIRLCFLVHSDVIMTIVGIQFRMLQILITLFCVGHPSKKYFAIWSMLKALRLDTV